MAQKSNITLHKNENWGFPFHFYVIEVKDVRKSPTLGSAYNAQNQAYALLSHSSLEKFVQSYAPFTRDSLAYPVIVRIKQLDIHENISNKSIKGTCKLQLNFTYLRNDTEVSLCDFQTNTSFTRSQGLYEHYDILIEKAMLRAFTFMNDWMKNHFDKDLKLAKRLEIAILPDASIHNPDQGDSLFWSLNRKLRWTDFHGKPSSLSRYAAQVFTNFEYAAQVVFENGIIKLNLQMKTYLLKSSSWNAAAGTSLYALEHEQLHFDITKLIVERFKQKALLIQTPEDYDSALQLLFIDMYREMNQMQKQYDEETNHSLNAVAQERWRAQVQNELRSLIK